MTSAIAAQREKAAAPSAQPRADVAEVVDAEVDAREADQRGQHDPGDDDRGAAAIPGRSRITTVTASQT